MSKRRPSGDGLIRKRSDGRWEGRIVVGHRADGYPIYRSVFAKTQRELMPKLNQLKEYYAGMSLTEHRKITLGEWLDRWRLAGLLRSMFLPSPGTPAGFPAHPARQSALRDRNTALIQVRRRSG